MSTRKSKSRRSPSIETKNVFDVFQPGLVRGEASFKHKPDKKVFYVEHPKEGWRVFLRAVCFIHEEGQESAGRFIVLKKTGMDHKGFAWEAPKGQMEGKDGLAHPQWSVLKLLKENIRRETKEEAKISKFIRLEHLPQLVVQAKESEYGPHDYFQYHVFRAVVKSVVLEKTAKLFAYYKAHPEAFAALSSDDNEKDAIAWYDPRRTKIMGRWSPTLVKLYLAQKRT
jgi:8-oxo-dGTP pyrophosphatase MutT (NUDIX family)